MGRQERGRQRGPGANGGGGGAGGGAAPEGAETGAAPCRVEAGPHAKGRARGGRDHERGRGLPFLGCDSPKAPSVCPSGSRLDPWGLRRATYAHRKPTLMGRTTQPQGSPLRRPLGPHPRSSVTPFHPPPLCQCFTQSHPPPCHPHKGCAHTDPSRPCQVDTESSQVLMKTWWRPPAPLGHWAGTPPHLSPAWACLITLLWPGGVDRLGAGGSSVASPPQKPAKLVLHPPSGYQ